MSDSLKLAADYSRLLDEKDARIAELWAQAEKLQRFKSWVHNYLDTHGVPHHPPGTHGAEGCRIGDRMDWLMAQLADADGRAAANGARAAELREAVGHLQTVEAIQHETILKMGAQLSELEALLRPFADAYTNGLADMPSRARWPDEIELSLPIPLGAWRAAHRAVNPGKEPGGC